MAEILAPGFDAVTRLSRRRFMALGAATAAACLVPPTLALARQAGQGPPSSEAEGFLFPRVRFFVNDNTPQHWNYEPIGDITLLHKIQKDTGKITCPERRVVDLGDLDNLVRYPFVFMTARGTFKLPEQEERNLREFLDRGGFIYADDCVYNQQDRFFRSFVELMNSLYPDNRMRKIPHDHELFHIFYDFENGAPHLKGVPHGAFGLFEPASGRLSAIVTPGDVHCGWVNRWFSPEQNLAALKMGVNIVIYFLTH